MRFAMQVDSKEGVDARAKDGRRFPE